MISAFTNTWKIPELRDRILFTLALIVIIRLGVHITLPGVDGSVIKAWLDDQTKNPLTGGGISALLTVFSGGGLQQAGIFALGIMPYISASIMVQLMTAVVPKMVVGRKSPSTPVISRSVSPWFKDFSSPSR